MSSGMRIAVVAGVFALAAAFLLGGRYGALSNANGVGVYDRYTGRIYPYDTSYAPPSNAKRD
jgi:hypothetical protein